MSPATAHAGLPCTYHEISRATPANALLCAGLHRCLPILLRTQSEHDARRTVDAFSNLTPPAVPSEARFRAALDGLPDRWSSYRPALVLARYLLLGGSPEATAGAGGVRGWFLDMALLFGTGASGPSLTPSTNRTPQGIPLDLARCVALGSDEAFTARLDELLGLPPYPFSATASANPR